MYFLFYIKDFYWRQWNSQDRVKSKDLTGSDEENSYDQWQMLA